MVYGTRCAMTRSMTTYKKYLTWMTAVIMVISSVLYAWALVLKTDDLPQGVTKAQLVINLGVVHFLSDFFVWAVLALFGLVVVSLLNRLKTKG